MSREQWRKASSSGKQYQPSEWREAFSHNRLEGRTTDPEALEYDEAVDIFRSGLRCARSGDLEAGRAQIATAFLLDSRAVNLCMELPHPDAANLALDFKLCQQLASRHEDSFGTMVLLIMFSRRFGHEEVIGQEMIGVAMKAVDDLIRAVEQRPELERPAHDGGVLGGCLTRTNLYYHKSSLELSMGNNKLSIRNLSKALEIDLNYTAAREARASLWASGNRKDRATIHAEFKRIVSEVHEDNRANESNYAWLAITTLEDANLGSYEDAKHYYEMSLRASARRTELYGPRPKDQEPPVLEIAKQKMLMWRNNARMDRLRHDLDSAVESGDASNVKVPEGFELKKALEYGGDKRMRHVCLACGATAIEKGLEKLFACSWCKKVHYCSKDCQRKDWKNHKRFCSQASTKAPKMPMPPPSQPSRLDNSVAKEPIGVESGQARACARMKAELQGLYVDHGQRFATWWHDMSTVQKHSILNSITNNTIPHSRPTGDALRIYGSRFLCEYNLKDLTTKCGCSSDSSHQCAEHIYSDQVLHEIYTRALRPEYTESMDRDVIRSLISDGVLPGYPSIAFIVPPENTDGPEKYDIVPVTIQEDAPESVKQDTVDKIQSGVLLDANVEFWAVKRRVFALSVLVKLFDLYQEKVRRCLAKQPYERIIGCASCQQTCEGDEAVKCPVCRATWWCCKGCKMASDHGRKCPQSGASDSVVVFS